MQLNVFFFLNGARSDSELSSDLVNVHSSSLETNKNKNRQLLCSVNVVKLNPNLLMKLLRLAIINESSNKKVVGHERTSIGFKCVAYC